MNEWLKCSACKQSLAFSALHWVCSVSTCNRNRTRLVFCSVACWDSHVAVLRHREAWAVEATSPSQSQWQDELAKEVAAPTAAPEVRRQVISATPGAIAPSATVALAATFDRDPLIVVSKMKKYIRDRSGMNCSDSVAEMLSEHVRALCDEAIRVAAGDGRKTVLDRDVVRPRMSIAKT
jgi:hypothetical protein